MFRKFCKIVLITSMITAFLAVSANAFDPQWKEHQDEHFKQLGLKPGDKIDKTNWKKVEGLVPDDFIEWVKDGRMIMEIGQFAYDASNDAEWDEYGAKHNAGKFTLDKKQNIIEAGTGKFAEWIYGYPFPNIDFEKDPVAGLKLMQNRDLCKGRDGSAKCPFSVEWIGSGGLERAIVNNYYRYYFWGTPQGKETNPKKLMVTELTVVLQPYDVSGTAQLTYRKIDGSDDELYVYIPAIRRTKRMSGANRSDPFMGSDFTIDDGNGWLGHTSKMKWKYLGEKLGLMCVAKYSSQNPTEMKGQEDGSWKAVTDVDLIKVGWEVKGTTQATYSPVTSVWVPRMFHVTEAVPKDPYYNVGKMEFWLDKKTMWIQYKLMWDIAGEYWKTASFMPQFMFWDNRVTQASNLHLFYDVKTKHATVLRSSSKDVYGMDLFYEFNVPNMKEKFTVGRLGTWTK